MCRIGRLNQIRPCRGDEAGLTGLDMCLSCLSGLLVRMSRQQALCSIQLEKREKTKVDGNVCSIRASMRLTD